MPDNVLLNSGTGGETLATDLNTATTAHHQRVKLDYGALDTFNLVSSANPLPVATASSGLTQISGTVTVVNTSSGLVQISGTPTVVSASSGLVQISGTPTVTATAGTNPWSSAPGFNLAVVNTSSGLVQISGTPTVVSASSGLIQISGNPTIIVGTTAGTAIATSSAAGLPFYLPITPTSSVAGASISPVTSSFGALVNFSSGGYVIRSLSSGLVTLSSQHTITADAGAGTFTVLSASSGLVQISGTPTVTATAGTNPWSSAPGFNIPVVSVSSGLVQISGTPTVTATAGTNPWSSAPGFNMPVVSVSSGVVRALHVATVTTSGLLSFHKMSTGGAVATNITTGSASLVAYGIFNSTATPQAVKFYNSTAPTVGGSTANLVWTIGVPGSTGGGGANLAFPTGIYSSNGFSFVITAGLGDTDTGAPGTNNIACNVAYVI